MSYASVLSFSYRLTNEVEVDFATDGQSASSSWCLHPLSPMTRFSFYLFDKYFFFFLM
jgi:hypothetical protein